MSALATLRASKNDNVSSYTHRGRLFQGQVTPAYRRDLHQYDSSPKDGAYVRRINPAMFEQIAAEWLADTRHDSSSSMIKSHPAFRRIVAMGDFALRAIVRDLEQGNIHWQWFLALRALTGANPVPPESRGLTLEIAKAWIDWARLNLSE